MELVQLVMWLPRVISLGKVLRNETQVVPSERCSGSLAIWVLLPSLAPLLLALPTDFSEDSFS